jgi:prepilin-type N-terminal cleavage/methylation domain-containing protein
MTFYTKKAFTLVELIVSTTILAILTTIGFYTYTQYISDARDSVRKTDISTLDSQLNLYKKQRGAYPLPWDYFEIHNRWEIVAYQWQMNQDVSLTTADSLPTDPELKIPYMYATTKNRQEHQLGLSIYNNDIPYAFIAWSYKSVSKNILPNILLATGATSAVEINSAVWAGATNRTWFLFSKW